MKQWNYLAAQKKLIDKTKYGENVPSLEVVEVVLVQCNFVDNQYQQKSEVLYPLSPKCFWKFITLSLMKLL